MSAEEITEIQSWIDESSQRYREHCTGLQYLIEWLLKTTNMHVYGTTEVEVLAMTQFKQIELLERLWKNREMIGHSMLGDIGRFIAEVDKFGFRTADDFA